MKHPAASSLLFSLVLGGCALVDPYNMIGRHLGDPVPQSIEPTPPAGTVKLTVEQREKAFDFVWTTINERYHDPSLNGTDWNAVGQRYKPVAMAAATDTEFWDVLDRMTGELKDAHTRVESPAQSELRRRDESITLGFSFVRLGDRLVVSGVNVEGDAWWAGVRSGMTIVTIAGEPALAMYGKLEEQTRHDSTGRSRHLRAVRRLMTGDLGSSVAFTFERADGTRFDTTLSRRKVSTRPTESHRKLPSGFGYIRFTQWRLGIIGSVLGAVDELKDTPGLIIDLRANGGGAAPAVNQLLRRFFTQDTEIGRTTTRTGEPVSVLFGAVEIIKLKSVIDGRADAYKGKVVVLVNASSASASELFAAAMQATGRAKIVGEPTCGCLLGFLGYARIPGGGDLAYSEVGFVMSNGKRIEGEGIVPDHTVIPTQRDYQLNRDRALEEAQAVLASMEAPAR
jgi:carboxyl-terminal processing protease